MRDDAPPKAAPSRDPLPGVSLPVEDRKAIYIISDATGETVSRVMPARWSASVLAIETSGRLWRQKPQIERMKTGVGSIGQCNTARSLSAGVSKAKVFRGR